MLNENFESLKIFNSKTEAIDFIRENYLDKSNRTISGKLKNSIDNNALFLGFIGEQ